MIQHLGDGAILDYMIVEKKASEGFEKEASRKEKAGTGETAEERKEGRKREGDGGLLLRN